MPPTWKKNRRDFPYRKSPRRLPGDEERGLPDWYTKHLEEDLHALGLPNRLEIPGGKKKKVDGGVKQEMDSKGDKDGFPRMTPYCIFLLGSI